MNNLYSRFWLKRDFNFFNFYMFNYVSDILDILQFILLCYIKKLALPLRENVWKIDAFLINSIFQLLFINT